MPYIPTDPVESSNIEAIGYDRKTSTLRIAFHGRGGPVRVYDYPMFPEPEYRKLLEAESKGKFFNARIKPMYAYRTPRPEELEAPPEDALDLEDTTPESGPDTFWSPVEGGERSDGSVPSTTTHAHDGIEVHDHEDGDECHVHDADGLPVAVPPSALPRTSTGEVDYEAIPDASYLFPDRDDLLDMPCRCCGLPLRVPPEDALGLCAACYRGKGGDTNDPCSVHATPGD